LPQTSFAVAATQQRDGQNFRRRGGVSLANVRHTAMPFLFFLPMIFWSGLVSLAHDDLGASPSRKP